MTITMTESEYDDLIECNALLCIRCFAEIKGLIEKHNGPCRCMHCDGKDTLWPIELLFHQGRIRISEPLRLLSHPGFEPPIMGVDMASGKDFTVYVSTTGDNPNNFAKQQDMNKTDEKVEELRKEWEADEKAT